MNDNSEPQYVNEENETPPGRMKKIKRALKQCRAEKQEYLTGWQRAQADFQNYKKQQSAELDEFRKFINQNTISKILPVLDNLALICDLMPESERESSWAKGVINICRQLDRVMKAEGVEEIPVKNGDAFNPEIHEAIGETQGDGQTGTIAEVAQRGYKLNGKVIQIARVKVFK